MYHGVIYFAGPKSRWSQRIDESETIASVHAPWRWLARQLLLGAFSRLDPERCGYALLCDGVCIEHYDPPLE